MDICVRDWIEAHYEKLNVSYSSEPPCDFYGNAVLGFVDIGFKQYFDNLLNQVKPAPEILNKPALAKVSEGELHFTPLDLADYWLEKSSFKEGTIAVNFCDIRTKLVNYGILHASAQGYVDGNGIDYYEPDPADIMRIETSCAELLEKSRTESVEDEF